MALKGVPQRTFAIPFLDTPACLILRTGRDSLCDTQVLIKPDGVQDAGIRGETGHGMNGEDYSRWVRQKNPWNLIPAAANRVLTERRSPETDTGMFYVLIWKKEII